MWNLFLKVLFAVLLGSLKKFTIKQELRLTLIKFWTVAKKRIYKNEFHMLTNV